MAPKLEFFPLQLSLEGPTAPAGGAKPWPYSEQVGRARPGSCQCPAAAAPGREGALGTIPTTHRTHTTIKHISLGAVGEKSLPRLAR